MMKDGSHAVRGRRRLGRRKENNLAEFSTREESGDRTRRALFLKSERHSARVRRVRIGIIAISGMLTLLLCSLIFFNPLKHLPKNISIGTVQVDGTNVIVDKPKIAGFQQNGLPFEITARSGMEDVLKPNILKLLGVRAKLTLADLSQLEILAKKGVYDNQSDSVLLQEDVRIKNTGNYLIEMDRASLDFKTNVFSSDRFSSMQLSNGRIESPAIIISNNGDRISFEGGVKSTFDAAPAGTDQK